ncbi:Hsp20/alpha crystallin family protein [Aeoliella mucimassa]|uniref:Spore protein SP21 n=1 Tax=Aeoliella mucimassa TaxID=2527972 RepID=A0A518ATV1_9BACT|nr:Hsp20/alpha crystallin family protein [Aeoliella mucimassa]QDU58126.1 Spore protein SP21 [Aeoliella mucimassa]
MKTTHPNNRLQNLFPAAIAEVDSFVDQFFGPAARGSALRAPVSIWEGENQLYLEIDAPGVTQEGVEVTFEKGQLTLSLERKAPEYEGKLWHAERGFGKVTRTLSLPETVDPETIEASLRDGVLQVTIGKRPELQPKKIEVKIA